MAARIRTSTFLGAVNQLVTATTRPSESAQGNKFNPRKVRIPGRADLECGLGHSFISGVVGCKKWLWAWATATTTTNGGVGSRDCETTLIQQPTTSHYQQPFAFNKCHPFPHNRSKWPSQPALRKEIRVPGRLSDHAVPLQGPRGRSLTRPTSRARTSSQLSYVAFCAPTYPTVFSRQ